MAQTKSSSVAKSTPKSGKASQGSGKGQSSRRPDFSVQSLKMSDIPRVEPLDDEKVEVQYEQPSMKVNHVPDDARDDARDEEEVYEEEYEEEQEEPMDPFAARDIIRVRFGSFVQLVADHELEDVIERNADQEIIMSSNLLTELAGSKDRREEKKVPLVFLVGIAIGVVLTYIFFSG